MDVSCPSLPPKILVPDETDAKLRPNEQTTAYMAADGCHLSIGSLYVLLVNIEVSSSQYATRRSRELSCIKYQARSCQALSLKTICEHVPAMALIALPTG